jgi:hypothetical protein
VYEYVSLGLRKSIITFSCSFDDSVEEIKREDCDERTVPTVISFSWLSSHQCQCVSSSLMLLMK